MYIRKLPNAAASKISVTSTATSLYDLIATAASAAHGLPGLLNSVDITVEDGDIRILFDGNTPTAANGILLSSGVVYQYRGVPLAQMKLIRAGGSDVACSVQVGTSEQGETSNAAAYAVTLEASSVSIGDVVAAGDVAHDAVDSGNPIKIGGKAQDPTSLPAAVSADDRADMMTDLYGRTVVVRGDTLDAVNDEVSVTPRNISHASTTALAASLVAKAAAGKCFEVRGINNSLSAQYIQVHDASSLPADTAVPETVHYAGAGSPFSISYPQGKTFSTGIVISNSSTLATKTIGSADCWIEADYE